LAKPTSKVLLLLFVIDIMHILLLLPFVYRVEVFASPTSTKEEVGKYRSKE